MFELFRSFGKRVVLGACDVLPFFMCDALRCFLPSLPGGGGVISPLFYVRRFAPFSRGKPEAESLSYQAFKPRRTARRVI